jgi:hypothetical protein
MLIYNVFSFAEKSQVNSAAGKIRKMDLWEFFSNLPLNLVHIVAEKLHGNCLQ